jgi:acetyl-CoA acyltransferase
MRDVVVALALRTPGGRAKRGTFRQTRPDDLGAAVIRALANARTSIRAIGDWYRCAMPEGEQGLNVGRNLVLLAGLPNSVPGMTVNRFCSSGLESINIAAAEIALGQVDVAIAGGVESMTLVPMGGMRYLPNPTMVATSPGTYLGMGLTAERLAARDGSLARRRTRSPTTAT